MSCVFVWLRTQLGPPEPQIWHLPLVGAAHLQSRVIAQHPLPIDAAALPLGELARRYPAPPEPEESE